MVRYFLMVLLFIISLKLTPTFAFSDNPADDNTGKDNPHVIHLYNQVSLIATLKISYANPHIMIKAVYPQFTDEDATLPMGDNPSANTETANPSLEQLNQLVLDLVKQSSEEFRQQVTDSVAMQKHLPRSLRKNNLYIDYDTSVITANRHHLISIRFSLQSFIGGMAHPYHFHRVINYDVKEEKVLTLADLFQPGSDYLSIFSNYTREALAKHLKETGLILEGTSPTVDHFKIWNISPKGILITFDQGQVAPYVNGAQTVLVPYAILSNILNPQSPVASCFKNPRHCANTYSATGGFIDEAINTHHRRFNPIFS